MRHSWIKCNKARASCESQQQLLQSDFQMELFYFPASEEKSRTTVFASRDKQRRRKKVRMRERKEERNRKKEREREKKEKEKERD